MELQSDKTESSKSYVDAELACKCILLAGLRGNV